MNFKIKQGLFNFDFTDQHAILGVAMHANPEEIRQRYKQVARLLHPDSSKTQNQAEKERAVQLLSKLVSPAYAQLFKERNRAEYGVMVEHMKKRLASEAKIPVVSVAAKQLAQAGDNLSKVYSNYVQKLADKQYQSLDRVLDTIAVLSELNMVYLILTYKEENIREPLTNDKTLNDTSSGFSTEEQKRQISKVEPYMRRAAAYMIKNNFAKATLELRDALTLEPNNSSCHSLLGMTYLKQNLLTMAKVHLNRALELNPQDSRALQGKQMLEKLSPKETASKTTNPSLTGEKPSTQSSGGLFGGLFGGKKK
ncbi:MAG: hypothetical protein NVS2B14_13920 [Chamaesiphon sp.]